MIDWKTNQEFLQKKNRQIAQERKAGARVCDLVKKWTLTRARIYQICEKYNGYTNSKDFTESAPTKRRGK